jgi:DNA-binding MarR family transcriptional regulator
MEMKKRKRMAELTQSLTVLLGRSQAKFINKVLGKGLSSKQVGYLTAISQLGNPSMSDLTRKLMLSNPSITAIIKKFCELGYVEKIRSEDDGRSYHIHLAEKGRELERLHQQSHTEMADALMQNLDDADVDRLIGLLEKIVGK